MSFLSNLNISSPTFWLGIIGGVLLAWLLYRFLVYLPKLIRRFNRNVGGIRQNLTSSADVRLRNDTHRFVQKQHLAAKFFSLDEIAIVPKVLIPLIPTTMSVESAPTDSVSLTVPYIPDWPELAAVYKASTMTLVEALQGGANIILAGHPGSGKTVALAWLASSLARNEQGLGNLAGFLPLYVHACDIRQHLHSTNGAQTNDEKLVVEKSKTSKRPRQKKDQYTNEQVDILVKSISTYASPLTITRLPGIIRTALEREQAILLLDGVDELPPSQAVPITEYIESLLEKYPKLRVIAALSYDNLAGLPPLGFSTLGMAAWGEEDRDQFLLHWGQLWRKWIYPSEKDQAKKVKSYFLNSWLRSNNSNLKPLEFTLKVWSAYAGDILGTDGPSAIEAHIRRMTGIDADERSGLEYFALQSIIEMETASNPEHTSRFFRDLERKAKATKSEIAEEEATSDQQPDTGKPIRIKSISTIDTLTNNGFLINRSGTNFSFSHPIFCGYLAGSGLANSGMMNHVQSQPNWIGKTLAMYYYSRVGDVTPFINDLIQEDDILHSNHLTIARWLQIAPKNRQWRSTILRTLTTILNKERDTLSLAAKIVSAMAFSGDTGVSYYFRQLLKSDHPNLKQLGALGCGVLAEKKAIEDLNMLVQEQSPASIRAGSLALAAIADKQSLEILASTLLNGSELARRCAAEALANNPIEGHPALKDGSTMEDLLVRRSVAFGLVRINQPWATKIVENLQLEDNEWVVRNAALQAFDEFRRRNSLAPQPLMEPTETQWLIDYAAKIGTSVAPGKPADELVINALISGTSDVILNALDYLRHKCEAYTINDIFGIYSNNTGELRDAAYYVLWLMMISGIKLPLSVKYNIQ